MKHWIKTGVLIAIVVAFLLFSMATGLSGAQSAAGSGSAGQQDQSNQGGQQAQTSTQQTEKDKNKTPQAGESKSGAPGQQGETAGSAESQSQSAPPADQSQGQEKTLSLSQASSHIGGLTGHAEAGQADYRRFCIGCHGPLGDGQGENAPYVDPKPRDFTEAKFECRSTPTGTLPTDEDLFNTISRGIEASNMPSWYPLTDQKRADLIAYVKTFSPRWAAQKAGTPIQIPPETPITMDSIDRGHALWNKMECFKCHGPQGRGDGPSADTLTDDKNRPIRPYNFHEGSRFKCGTTNQDLYKIFMTGLDGTPMPSFADQLKPNEAWDLVHYLRTLQPNHHGPEQVLIKSHENKSSQKTAGQGGR
jgi:mono/diheme cytochrome c family protein